MFTKYINISFVNSFVFVINQFSWFSVVKPNHEMQCTTKGINNQRSHVPVSKPRVQIPINVSVSVIPLKLTPTKISETSVFSNVLGILISHLGC
jgi:hypothetical protein